MSDDAKPDVRNNPDRNRFELWRDGELVGRISYERRGHDLLALAHTQIDTRLEGQGLGSALIRATLDDLRAAGVRVLPVCPFVRAFVQHHPEYAEVVPEEHWDEYGIE